MQIDRIKGVEVVRWTDEERRNLYGESISDWFNWVSECADPDEVRKAPLKAWGLLKRNADLTGEQSSQEDTKHGC
ncbi:hypothetical protein [Parasutterella excrementihominis]|jgi:hypothetical protein|uniref:hypothetical protein n=1 Tax=Parasutterella excrementihominis TaxID=487175 RepID=UPI00352073BA